MPDSDDQLDAQIDAQIDALCRTVERNHITPERFAANVMTVLRRSAAEGEISNDSLRSIADFIVKWLQGRST